MSILIGSFSAEAQPLAGTTSRAQNPQVGMYTVEFSQTFETLPSVVVSPQTDNLGYGTVIATSLGKVTNQGFTVFFQNLGSSPDNVDTAFSFFASESN